MSALVENFKVHIHAKTKSKSSADFIHFLCINGMYVSEVSLEYNDIFFKNHHTYVHISKQPVIRLEK